jgi:hypothetical protein
MPFARRATGVATCFQPQVKRLVIKTAADDEDLLRVGMGLSSRT